MIEQKRYTYDEWLKLDLGGRRAELVDGVVRMMASSSNKHQAVAGEMFVQIHNALKGKPCRVFYELDTKLKENRHTVYSPDIIVVCELAKLNKGHGCHGAPDFVIEVFSPSTSQIDKTEKLNAYCEAGVKEYWMVDPNAKTVDALDLEKGKYTIRAYSEADKAPVQTLEGLEIDLSAVFRDELLNFE